MKKILFLTRSINIGGAERQLLTLAASLDQTRFNPVVVTFYSGGTLLSEFQAKGIRVRSASKGGRWDVTGFIHTLLNIIHEEKPDIIMSFLVAANILSIFIKPFVKDVRLIISIRHSYLRKEDYDFLSTLLYWLEDHFARFSDRIIINSYIGAKLAIERGIPGKKIVVIPNGIDTDTFISDQTIREKKRNELKFRPDEIVIGIIGRLDPVKDHRSFIKAASILHGKNTNLRFLIVGDGNPQYYDLLKQDIRSSNLETVVQIIPAETNPVPIYNALDICVSSSVGEGFSNVIAEAMSCQVPCVVTEVGDSPHIVGETGYTTPAGNPNSLADAILRMAELPRDDRKNLGKMARLRIEEEFSVAKMVSATSAEIDSLG